MPYYGNKKVILTGATGLIGKEAIEPLLNSGFEIYALTIEKIPLHSTQINWIQCNLLDESVIKKTFEEIKPDYLLHFAWVASGDYLTSDINYQLRDASLNILKVFQENGGKRAVFAGTCFEYEFKNEPLKETDKLNPQTVYAKCKNELREKAQKFCEENEISFGWGRIFYVYGHGENEKRLTSHLINSLRQDKEVIITAGKLVRDYIYTKDIAGAFVKFLDTNVEGCVNICTNKPISIEEYARTIAKKLGKENLLVFRDESQGQPAFIVGDNSRLKNEVGYKLQYSLNEALDKIIEK